MRTLIEFLTESGMDIKSMKEYIISKIVNDEISMDNINKIYNISKEARLTPQLVSLIDNFFKDRDLTNKQTYIISIFKDNGDFNTLVDIITNRSKLPSSQELLNTNNVYDLFDNLGISKKTIMTIANAKDPGKVAKGKFEMLCNLLLNDITTGNVMRPGAKGDLNTLNSGVFEFKCAKARLRGSILRSPEAIDNEFKRIIQDNYGETIYTPNKGIFGSEKNCEAFFKSIRNRINIDDDKLLEITGASIAKQFTDDKYEIIYIQNFLKHHKDDLIKNNIFNVKLISKIFGCLDLYYYQKTEGWDYLVYFKDTTSGACSNISSDDASDLDNIYDNKNIMFSGKPTPGMSTEYAAYIELNTKK